MQKLSTNVSILLKNLTMKFNYLYTCIQDLLCTSDKKIYLNKNNCLSVNLPLCGLLLIAILISIYLCLKNPNIGGDALRYLYPIHNLLEGNGYTYMGKHEVLFSPGMGITALVPYLFLKDIEFSGMAVSAISYLLSIILVYKYISHLLNKKIALMAASMVTLSPSVIAQSYLNMVDMYFIFTMLLVYFELVCLFKSATVSMKRIAILGCILGLSTLVRPDGLLLLFSASIVVMIRVIVCRAGSTYFTLVNIIKTLSLMNGVFLLAVIPYVLYLHHHTGLWTVSIKYAGALAGGGGGGGMHPDITSWEMTMLNALMIRLNEIPAWFQWIRANSVSTFYSFIRVSFFMLLPLLIVWLIYPFISNKRVVDVFEINGIGPQWFIIAIGLCWPILPNLNYVVVDRIIAPYWVLLHICFVLLLYGFLDGIELLKSKLKWRTVYIAFITVMLASEFIAIPIGKHFDGAISTIKYSRHAHSGFRSAGLWLNANGLSNELFMSRRPDVFEYYLLGKREPTGQVEAIRKDWTIENHVSFMKMNNINFLVLDDWYIKDMPKMKLLWDNAGKSRSWGLELIYEDPNELSRVFRLARI